MNDQPISVVIADRTYRLTVKGNEEAFVRDAAKSINAKVKTFSDQYAYRDKQDLLAMVALQLATDQMMTDEVAQSDQEQLKIKLNELNLLLDTTF